MHLRTPLAAVLLSCAAYGQEAPSELPAIPSPFTPKPKQFQFKRPFIQKAPNVTTVRPPAPAASQVCSVPLVTVTPKTSTAKMPVMKPDPNSRHAMSYVKPPAPPCVDERGFDERDDSPQRPSDPQR
jgi:hypothetical protein